jgi:hypothetical protein
MISVVELACCTVIVAWSVIVTPPAVAVMVLVSAVVERNVNVATPLEFVDAEVGVMVFPVPVAIRLTATPASRLLLASRTTTVMVLWLPTLIVDGSADTSPFSAAGPPGVAVDVKVTGEPLSPLTVAVVV